MTPTNIEDSVAKRLFVCRCGKPVFFRNSLCVACQAPLGYEPHLGMLYPMSASAEDPNLWLLDGVEDGIYRRCSNLDSPAGCNWLIRVEENQESPAFCVACQLNRTIPDLSIAGNAEKWRRIEVAKRRLVSSLLRLGLPVVSRLTQDPENGLAFDFLTSAPGGRPVMTGHEDGIITVNVDEAEDVKREQVRREMNERYRTILGHLRHESGHYYWDRIVAGTERLEGFRRLFGDDREDYGAALERHHSQGPPPGWNERFVSAYASSHPWEDWAETWAHYLHMTDTLDTAFSFKLDLQWSPLQAESFGLDVLEQAESGAETFLNLLNKWIQLTAALNELSFSMGLSDFYPFILTPAVVNKLHFIHATIAGWRTEHVPHAGPGDSAISPFPQTV